LQARIGRLVLPFGNRVILELKFTDRFPRWFQMLVEAFGLTRGPAAKYAGGVALIGEEMFYRQRSFEPAEPAGTPESAPESDVDNGDLRAVNSDVLDDRDGLAVPG
jgi:hypothetical protein